MFYEYNHFGSPDYMKLERGCDFSFPPHLHQCFEIIIILSGQMNIMVDGKSISLSPNEGVLIFPNQIHSLSSTHSEHILCIFSPHLVQAYSTKISDRIPVNNRFSPDPYLIHLLAQVQDASSSAHKKGLLYLLCAQFDSTANYCAKQNDSQKLLYRIFSFVEKNYTKNCSLSSLSNEIGYDYAYLSRYFKKTIGLSFNAYVTHYRLSYACYLMENTDLPIIQCAFDSGFTSLRNFNRSFKEKLEMSPTQYRRNIQS